MSTKIELLRQRGAVEELERRWEEDDDFAERYNDSRLKLYPGVDLPEQLPAGLHTLYSLTDRPRFGDLVFYPHSGFRQQKLIDAEGELGAVADTLTIGRAGEQSIVLDVDTEAVFIFDFMYFQHDLDSGLVLRCDSVAEFISTVALGPRYSYIHGPHETWDETWWSTDPWYLYLQELDLA